MIVSTPIPASDPGFIDALAAAGLPTDDIGDAGRQFFRVERNGSLLGYGGFELYDEDALLRSIVVPENGRGKGHGRAVTQALFRQVAEVGGRRTFLLTAAAADFFKHLGFAQIDRIEAPTAILATRQASSICSSAALLSRDV